MKKGIIPVINVVLMILALALYMSRNAQKSLEPEKGVRPRI